MRESLLKKRYGIPIALLVALLAIGGAVAAYIHCTNISYKARQYMVHSSKDLDLEIGYVSADHNVNYSKDFGEIGTCTTWAPKDVKITQTKDLTGIFSEFRVIIQLDKGNDGWPINTGAEDVQVSRDMKASGATTQLVLPDYGGTAYPVLLKVEGKLLEDIGDHEILGTAHLEFSFPE